MLIAAAVFQHMYVDYSRFAFGVQSESGQGLHEGGGFHPLRYHLGPRAKGSTTRFFWLVAG
jgi:hypothetical protein